MDPHQEDPMQTLLAAATEPDGVNLFPFLVGIVLLAAAALVAYLRRRGQ
jgi:hypothetical protein